MSDDPRVLVIHNRYRTRGGEERAVELQLQALERNGVVCRALERDSGAVGLGRAARSLVGGGERPEEVTAAVEELGATTVHMHNMQPLFGPRAIHAAREAGARVVLELHNFRLFCAIGVAYRDGAPCYDCHHGRTWPGLRHNCRGSLPQAAAYAYALRSQIEPVLALVDDFVAPSEFAAGQLAELGVPSKQIGVLRHYLPADEFAERSRADQGSFVLVAGRLSREKGVALAVEAAAAAGVPLKIAGEGPLEPALSALIDRSGADAELLGRLNGEELRGLRSRAGLVAVPSVWDENAPYAVMEAMADGVPVIASRAGGLPELVGDERCVPRGDADALARALGELMGDPARRAREGDAMLDRARELFAEDRYVSDLRALYV